MNDPATDLLTFLFTCLFGVAGAGIMFGRAAVTHDIPWIFVGGLAVLATTGAFIVTLRWLHKIRDWQYPHPEYAYQD